MRSPTTATPRRYRRSSGGSSSSVRSPARGAAATQISDTEKETPDHRRSRASPSGSSSSGGGTAPSGALPSWVILNRVGARRDNFDGDRTTSSVSHTSTGERISVSFELVEPPGTSLLVLDWPQGPHPMKSTLSYPPVLAADGDAVLFEVSPAATNHPSAPDDYFVYRASGDPSGRPSLSRLPVCYYNHKRRWSTEEPLQRRLSRVGTGLLCPSKDFFIVAILERSDYSLSAANLHLQRSVHHKWEVIENVSIRGVDDGCDLRWWYTDAVLTYLHQSLIWVDYYRGMITANMSTFVLQYVPLPVDPVQGNPEDCDYGRGCPEASRSLCVAHGIIKFVAVNTRERSSGFSITVWSLSRAYTWIEDATLDAKQLWDRDCENRLPHVLPEFPVVDRENPDVVCLLLNESRHNSASKATTWMIKVHMKEKRPLQITAYSPDASDKKDFMIAREMSLGSSFITSGMPLWYSFRQAMKRAHKSEEAKGGSTINKGVCPTQEHEKHLKTKATSGGLMPVP
ncbi:hypothetical protein ACP70R_003866 [Stipagrostis hirtigluma subsp. patula]